MFIAKDFRGKEFGYCPEITGYFVKVGEGKKYSGNLPGHTESHACCAEFLSKKWVCRNQQRRFTREVPGDACSFDSLLKL